MAYPTEIDAIPLAPTSGTLGGTTPTQTGYQNLNRSALLSIKAKIDSLPTANVIPAGASLATVQAAVNATDATFGGGLVLTPGEYDWASGHLTLPSNRQITIDGYGANIFYSGTTGAVIDGVDVNNITIRGLRLWGPGQTTGSGNGIAFTLSTADNTPYIHIEDVQCWEFGGSGFVLPGLLASSLSGCTSTLMGGYGFDITQAGFGTSFTMNNCFGNACRKAGTRLTRMTYCSLNSCASDDCGMGYELVDCSAIHLNACGCETPVDTDAIVGGSTYDNYFGVGYKVTGGTSITFTSCFVLGLATSPGGDVGWWFTGNSTNCALNEPFEVDPGTSPEAALKVDTGSLVTVTSPRFLSPVTGATVNLYATGVRGRVHDAYDGTAGAPITTSGPTFKVARTETITRATVEAAGSSGTDGADQVGAIMGISTGVGSTQTQPVGVCGVGLNQSTNNLGGTGAIPDACGLYGVGRITGSGTGTGIGAFVIGRRDTTTGNACGLEVHSANFAGAAAAYNSTGFSPAHGMWVNAGGDADSAAGITVSNAFGRQFAVGLAFTAQVNNSKTGGVKDVSIRDDSTSSRSINIKGTHATAAIGIAAGSGYVGVGTESPGAVLHVVSPASGAKSVKIQVGASQTDEALVIRDSADTFTLCELTPFGHVRTGGGATDFPALAHAGDADSGVGFTGTDGVYVSTNSVVRQRWDNAGVQFGPTVAFGGGTGVVGITNATVVPSTNPSGGGVLYVESGFLKYRGSSGTVTQLAAA